MSERPSADSVSARGEAFLERLEGEICTEKAVVGDRETFVFLHKALSFFTEWLETLRKTEKSCRMPFRKSCPYGGENGDKAGFSRPYSRKPFSQTGRSRRGLSLFPNLNLAHRRQNKKDIQRPTDCLWYSFVNTFGRIQKPAECKRSRSDVMT